MHLAPVSSDTSSAEAQRRLRRVIFEALDLVAEPDEARAIAADALRMARRSDIPTLAAGLLGFVEGHLLDAVEGRLGAEAADRFAESIDVVLRAANAAYESGPVPARGSRGCLVAVVSRDPQRVVALSQELAHHADVEPVDPEVVPSMLFAQLASAVVLDWSSAPMAPELLDPIVDALGAGRLVLWGAPREVEWRFVDAERRAWVSVPEALPVPRVAKRLLAMIARN